jgi:hypothetical protein
VTDAASAALPLSPAFKSSRTGRLNAKAPGPREVYEAAC